MYSYIPEKGKDQNFILNMMDETTLYHKDSQGEYHTQFVKEIEW
jgi:hypothetical protein